MGQFPCGCARSERIGQGRFTILIGRLGLGGNFTFRLPPMVFRPTVWMPLRFPDRMGAGADFFLGVL